MVYHESPFTMGIICLLKPRSAIALRLGAKRLANFWVGDATPKMGEEVGARGSKMVSIRKFNIGFLLAPHSDQSAISNRFRRTQQRCRQTDRRTDKIGSNSPTSCCALTRLHRSVKNNQPVWCLSVCLGSFLLTQSRCIKVYGASVDRCVGQLPKIII